MSENKGDSRTVLLRDVVASFTDSLHTARPTVENGEPKHTMNVILVSNSKYADRNKKSVAAALTAASEEEFKRPDMWRELMEEDPKRCSFRPGKRFKNSSTGEIYKGYEGNYAIACAGPRGGKVRPRMLDRHKRAVDTNDILDVVYSGTRCDALVSFYGTKKGGNGVFATIEMVRSYQEGERIGGSPVNVDAYLDELDDLEDDYGDEGSSSGGADDSFV